MYIPVGWGANPNIRPPIKNITLIIHVFQKYFCFSFQLLILDGPVGVCTPTYGIIHFQFSLEA